MDSRESVAAALQTEAATRTVISRSRIVKMLPPDFDDSNSVFASWSVSLEWSQTVVLSSSGLECVTRMRVSSGRASHLET